MRPIIPGIADFERLRAKGLPYADKTRLLYELAKTPFPFFLARPRRFGKSLLVSTLECILRGRRELFKGLWIDGSDYDWIPRPVIKLSMNAVRATSVDSLNTKLAAVLKTIFRKENLSIESDDPPSMLWSLAGDLHDKYGLEVAVLIDSYDSPVTHNITDPALAEETLESLMDFYGVLKGASKHIGLTFVTGVAMIEHDAISSSINHLVDLTLSRDYAGICGFTAAEFDDLFQEHLETGLDEFISTGQLPKGASTADLREAIFERYGGYSWDGRTRVLNPWSVLNCLTTRNLKHYCCRSADPDPLVKLVRERLGAGDLGRAERFLTDWTIAVTLDNLSPIPLMFQTGCLTIKRAEFDGGRIHHLGFPNLEAAAAMAPLLLLGERLAANQTFPLIEPARNMRQCLLARNAEGFRKACGAFFGSIPHKIKLPAHGHAALRLALTLAGLEPASDEPVAGGRPGLHFRDPKAGEDFVVEIKNVDIDGKGKKGRTLPDAVVAALTEEALQGAMERIEAGRRAGRFQGGTGKILKVAVVLNSRGGVTAAFEEASNRRLAESEVGGY